ncbi:uncharacterized protein PAC_09019 [Phialocephala subalpina]|uniref:Uncharacterized protein n=1 Tax=Phialocephala subalpina TaxID=576137 RepID=A0A1L7X297_9HELO|nr:uncharacterized protein PAC_09019 [Phialocephala subalpina]
MADAMDEDGASHAGPSSDHPEADKMEICSTVDDNDYFVASHIGQSTSDYLMASEGFAQGSTYSEGSTDSEDEENAVAFLALHLACTPEFHEAMLKMPTAHSSRVLRLEWLCNISFPASLQHRRDRQAWVEHAQQTNVQKRVLDSAKALYLQLPKDYIVCDWEKTKSPLPSFTIEGNRIREDLFRYHELRLGILDASKICEELHTRNVRLDIGSSQCGKTDLEKDAAQECQDALRSTSLEVDVIAHIDSLLATFEERSLPALAYPGNGLWKHQHAINWIKETNNFTPQYLETQEDSNPLVFMKAGKKDKATTKIIDPFTSERIPISSTQWSYGTLADIDGRLTMLVPTMFNDVDSQLFERNLQAFLNTRSRLPHIESLSNQFIKRIYPSEKSSRIKPDEIDSMDLLQDNIVHANALFLQLKRERGACYDSHLVSKIWYRLMSIAALCYGCVSEPAFLLTTMDRCLGELKEAFGCHIDADVSLDTAAAYETTVQTLGQLAKASQEKSECSEASRAYLSRIIMTDLALFIRALVLDATKLAGHRLILPQKEKYQRMLRWKDTCAVCKEPLTLPENFTRAISVGTRDARTGSIVARAETSSNRGGVYRCLQELCSDIFYVNCEIVFWYFANMYHRVCKPYREKPTALD